MSSRRSNSAYPDPAFDAERERLTIALATLVGELIGVESDGAALQRARVPERLRQRIEQAGRAWAASRDGAANPDERAS